MCEKGTSWTKPLVEYMRSAPGPDLPPQNNESVGKKKSCRISRAGAYLKLLLIQCAPAAIKIKRSRMLLTCLYHMFLKKEAFQPSDIHYEELPEQLFQKRKEQYIQQAIKLLEKERMTVVPPAVV